jgi:hypothetical protein
MKAWTLIGIPPIISAIIALIKEDDKAFLGESELSENWFVLSSNGASVSSSERLDTKLISW